MEKKKRAAIAAVMHYLDCEKAREIYTAEEDFSETSHAEVSPCGVSTWSLSGRQAQMQMRTMTQMKAFH
ncbi:MAG: hypothetical protein K9J79_04465 [Desulfobacteraceae bacterium]|nr:hypothetical protein [Desulfobacteraceae bacterium]MCF8094594.1 hypothetical protein [Desulfobacteraceae bacterium]